MNKEMKFSNKKIEFANKVFSGQVDMRTLMPLPKADTNGMLENEGISINLMQMTIDNKTFSLPCSNREYDHIPLLPSECNKFIKCLEIFRDNFTDEEIVCFNKQMNKEYINSLKGDKNIWN